MPGPSRSPATAWRIEGPVAGALGVLASQHDEQRGGVDGAVVLREWHLAQRRHLAAAHLVQDLAWCGIGPGRSVGGLKTGQPPEAPTAIVGSIHSICMAVMMPSRPKVVEYQGFRRTG